MRRNVYLFMGIAGYILAGVCIFLVIIDRCCYDLLSGTSSFVVITITLVVSLVLVRVGYRKYGKLKD